MASCEGRWEIMLSPKKPSSLHTPNPNPTRYHWSKKQYIILARPKLKQSSIQWLLLRHRFLTINATLYPQPTNPPSYHQTNEPALYFPWLHDISLEIDDALTAFHTPDRHLNKCITTLHHAEDDCSIYSIEELHSTTSALWTEISAVTGPPAQLGDNRSISHSEANDAPESTPNDDFDTPGRPFDIINFPIPPPTSSVFAHRQLSWLWQEPD